MINVVYICKLDYIKLTDDIQGTDTYPYISMHNYTGHVQQQECSYDLQQRLEDKQGPKRIIIGKKIDHWQRRMLILTDSSA